MFYRSDTGVSSVVGVIMMVAVTVVLASVVGQFVFGMVDDLHQPPQAGVVFKSDSGPSVGQYEVTVIVSMMPNADEVVIRPSNGPGMTFDEVGDSQTEVYDEGTTLTVLATKGSNSAMVQIYTVGG